MTLRYGDHAVEVTALLDTGAAMSVLPYNIGLLLGMKWHEQTVSIPLVGNLGSYEARAVAVLASHPQLTPNGPIQLGFAWTRSVNVPVLFGQINFFMLFNVCFYRAESAFEIQLAAQ